MAGADDLARMVPGFDFLQGLLKNAGAGLPAMGQWVAPTLDPAELDKRIQELKTVQFWLDQNSRLLATTIQALEVQRMTLSTLQTMNLPLADLTEALTIRTPPPAARTAPAPAPPPAPVHAPAPAAQPAEGDAPDDRSAAAAATPRRRSGAPSAPAAVDPMQWWGALTQQFTEIAARAMKDGAAAAAPAAAPGRRAPARKAAQAPGSPGAAAAAPAARKRAR